MHFSIKYFHLYPYVWICIISWQKWRELESAAEPCVLLWLVLWLNVIIHECASYVFQYRMRSSFRLFDTLIILFLCKRLLGLLVFRLLLSSERAQESLWLNVLISERERMHFTRRHLNCWGKRCVALCARHPLQMNILACFYASNSVWKIVEPWIAWFHNIDWKLTRWLRVIMSGGKNL